MLFLLQCYVYKDLDIQIFDELYIKIFGIDSLLDGERYYLTGEKGAGKTAMLIYTALKAEQLSKQPIHQVQMTDSVIVCSDSDFIQC